MVLFPSPNPQAVDGREREAYLRDRQAYVAGHFGLSVADYHEWVRLDGQCFCAGVNANGSPCKNRVSEKNLSPTEWRASHRVKLCPAHQYKAKRDECAATRMAA